MLFRIPLFYLGILSLTIAYPSLSVAQENAAHTKEIEEFQKEYKSALFDIIQKDTAYIIFYPIQDKFVLEANFNPISKADTFDLATSSGKIKKAVTIGHFSFKISRELFNLPVYRILSDNNKDNTHLFFPFKDLTTYTSSYGGGRYLDLDENEIKNNKIILDFNKAYNPYCAFTSGYNCPIPPAENFINYKIDAGESYWSEKFQP